MPSLLTHHQPWKHQSELALVRDWFYPHHVPKDIYAIPTLDNILPPLTTSTPQYQSHSQSESKNDTRSLAISKIKAWTLKTTVPHPIIATSELTIAQLTYEKYTNRLDNNNSEEEKEDMLLNDFTIKATYITAFTRFVNGFVDKDSTFASSSTSSHLNNTTITTINNNNNNNNNLNPTTTITTNTSSTSSSMYANATKLGMPRSFVDLRHRATHGKEMPGVKELRRGTGEALEWIWKTWWCVVVGSGKDGTDSGRARWEIEEWEREWGMANEGGGGLMG